MYCAFSILRSHQTRKDHEGNNYHAERGRIAGLICWCCRAVPRSSRHAGKMHSKDTAGGNEAESQLPGDVDFHVGH